MSGSASGSKRSSRQRERIVGSSLPGAWVTSRNIVPAGGSSSPLSSAFAAERSRSSIASITTTRRGDSDGVVDRDDVADMLGQLGA